MIALFGAFFMMLTKIISPEGGSDPLTTYELKRRLAESQSRVWAWEIEYESAREERPGELSPTYVHRLVAAKSPALFFHWSAHGTPWLDWRNDPDQQRLTITFGKMIAERPLDRLYIEQSLGQADALPGTAPQELLLIGIGWWPLSARPTPTVVDGLPASLAAVARSDGYQARKRLEQVGGRWCHVLEKQGRDQLWLDVNRGCAVVARQIFHTNPPIIQRVEFSHFEEVRPGLWFPFSFRNCLYDRAKDGGPGKVILDAKLCVLRVRINEQVEDARFQFDPLPGSIGVIDAQPLRQVVTGGEEYLDEMAAWIRNYSPNTIPPGNNGTCESWKDIALGALFGAGAIGTWAWRRNRIKPVGTGP